MKKLSKPIEEAFETMAEQGSRLLAARRAIVRKASIRLNLVFDSS